MHRQEPMGSWHRENVFWHLAFFSSQMSQSKENFKLPQMQPSTVRLTVFFPVGVSNFRCFSAGKDENFPQVRPVPILYTITSWTSLN